MPAGVISHLLHASDDEPVLPPRAPLTKHVEVVITVKWKKMLSLKKNWLEERQDGRIRAD